MSNARSVMRRMVLLFVSSLCAVGMAGPWIAAGTASALAAPSLAITPSSGPGGTLIHVTGTGCPDPGWDTTLHWRVHVQILASGSSGTALQVTQPNGTPHTLFAVPLEGYTGRADADTSVAVDGTWAVDVTMPGPGDIFAAVPGAYPVAATCYAAEGIEAGTIEYPSQTFTVPPNNEIAVSVNVVGDAPADTVFAVDVSCGAVDAPGGSIQPPVEIVDRTVTFDARGNPAAVVVEVPAITDRDEGFVLCGLNEDVATRAALVTPPTFVVTDAGTSRAVDPQTDPVVGGPIGPAAGAQFPYTRTGAGVHITFTNTYAGPPIAAPPPVVVTPIVTG